MDIGVVFPQSEIGADVDVIRSYAKDVEAMGYKHWVIYDHVVGADPVVHHPWTGIYDIETEFHEPMVFYGYLAGITAMDLMTSVIVLPQRQTVLVAKQAAQLDLLTKGRLRFGIGLGWNWVEYDSLGKNFKNRARRFEEQVTLLRRLWSERSVTFEGEWEQVKGIGLCPRPVQRPIPLWMGGNSPGAYRRAGRLGDGWIPDNVRPGPDLERVTAWVKEGAAEAGRDYSAIGMQGRVKLGHDDEIHLTLDDMLKETDAWFEAGCTHVAMNTMYSGLPSLDAHLDYLGKISDRLGLKAGV